MDSGESGKIGKRGTYVIPAELRRRYGLVDGALVVAEPRPEGILIRPAVALPTELYSPELRAAFLLENAVDVADYEAARDAVREMGLDPDVIEHEAPTGAGDGRSSGPG